MSANPEEVKDNVELPEVKVLDDEIKVEVVDDTPPEDRNRKPLPKEVVEELENDPLEEYSEKVQQRIKQMKKVWHDERRAKEAAAREKDEALRFAEAQLAENRKLKRQLGEGEKLFVGEIGRAAQLELAQTKEKLKKAYETGDPEQITEAQEALTDAKLRLQRVQDYQPTLQVDEDEVKETPRTQNPNRVQADPKAETWRQQNSWFGANKGMTAFALGLHQELVENGVDPTSDDYYDKINRAVRKRFPEAFEDDGDNNAERERPAPRKQTNTVVAPATRSTAPRQVRLTQSQLALAKKFGLTPEQYARELVKLEQNND